LNTIVLRLPCYRRFVRRLGDADAIVEGIELAVRDFVHRAHESADSSEFISQLSRQHGVRVNALDRPIFHTQVARFQVVSVYQQVELFLRELRAEHPSGAGWRTRKDKEPPLMYTVDCAGLSVGQLGQHRIDILEYYRLIRNQYLHSLDEKDSAADLLKRLTASKAQWQPEYPLNAPNHNNQLTFDDFILFTRAAKDVALQICRSLPATIDMVAAIILRLNALESSNVSIERLSRCRNGAGRLRQKLHRMLQSELGLQDADIAYLIGPDPNGLLAQLVERAAP
jgi:hypothetical protein